MTRIVLFYLSALSLIISAGCASRKTLSASAARRAKDAGSAMTDQFMINLLSRYPGYFDTLLKNNDKWRIQIIYTRIDRRRNNKPVFKDHFYNVTGRLYYYPASTVKMPVAALALQKINELHIDGLDKNTTMITEAPYSGQTPVYNDPDSRDGRPTIETYIKKIFLVSDNNAFNRLYEFLGQEYINNTLHSMGYDSLQIVHRLNISLTEDQNRHTNPVKFYDTASRIIYRQPLIAGSLVYQPRHNLLGKGFYQGNQLINQPFDFSRKNRFALEDLHSVLESILFPERVPRKKRFNLKPADYSFLYQYMSMKPRESDFPQYDSTYADAYSKLLLYGGKGRLDPDIRIFNKEGDAYGFLTDAAYIVDFKNNVEFILCATISCNSDEIFNDDRYDYETVGYPFLKNLGQVIYQYELQRKRKHIPDLSKFKMIYSK